MSGARSVLFVCRGNHCRSPMAEGAFRLAAQRQGWAATCDSAGTAPEREGEPPDRRAQLVAGRFGAPIAAQRSRKVASADFYRFDHIYALDRHVLAELQRMQPKGSTARLAILPGRGEKGIRDPFRGDLAGFYDCFAQIRWAMREVMAQL